MTENINYAEVDRGLLQDYIDTIDSLEDKSIIPKLANRFNIPPTDEIFLKNGINLSENKNIVKIDSNESKQ